MKNTLFLLLILSLLALTACEKKEEIKPVDTSNTQEPAHVIQIEDKIDAADYSYLEVSEKGNKYWIAVTKMDAQKGDILYYTKAMEMKNFHSKSLDRTFASILFVDDIKKTPHNMNETGTQETSPHSQTPSLPKMDIRVEPLKGGKTVEQIYNDKETLNGKVVKLRGKVTKFNPDIMDRNWIHIQDGTGSSNNYDLMVTSQDKISIGETVIVEGKLAINKDFGAGYAYAVIVEEAKVTAEKK